MFKKEFVEYMKESTKNETKMLFYFIDRFLFHNEKEFVFKFKELAGNIGMSESRISPILYKLKKNRLVFDNGKHEYELNFDAIIDENMINQLYENN